MVAVHGAFHANSEARIDHRPRESLTFLLALENRLLLFPFVEPLAGLRPAPGQALRVAECGNQKHTGHQPQNKRNKPAPPAGGRIVLD